MVKVTAMQSNPSTDSKSSNSRLATIFFLAFAGLIEGLVTLFAGGPIAQSHGEPRTWALICCVLAGLLGISYQLIIRPPYRLGSRPERLAFFVPVYAFCQILPLPIALVRVLSPSRATLAYALQPVAPLPHWIPISVAPSATLYHCLLFSACTSLFVVIRDLSRRCERLPWAVTLPLIAVGAVQSAIGLLQAGAGSNAVATGTYAIRNHYAGFLEMILPLAALGPFSIFATRGPSASDDHGLPGVVAVLLACLGVGTAMLSSAAILASLSRMGFVASLTSMVLIAIVALRRSLPPRRRPLIALAVGITAVILVVILPSAQLIARFGDLEQYGNDRAPAWHDTYKLIERYPLFGCGLGAYESAFLEFKTSAPALNQDYAHNDYLQYLAEMGIVGFAIAILPISAIVLRLRAGLRHRRPSIRWLSLACAGSAVAIGIHSLADFNLYVPANLFTLAWILGISAFLGDRLLVEPAVLPSSLYAYQ